MRQTTRVVSKICRRSARRNRFIIGVNNYNNNNNDNKWNKSVVLNNGYEWRMREIRRNYVAPLAILGALVPSFGSVKEIFGLTRELHTVYVGNIKNRLEKGYKAPRSSPDFGPVFPRDLSVILKAINEKCFLLLHAPLQTGKTLALTHLLNNRRGVVLLNLCQTPEDQFKTELIDKLGLIGALSLASKTTDIDKWTISSIMATFEDACVKFVAQHNMKVVLIIEDIHNVSGIKSSRTIQESVKSDSLADGEKEEEKALLFPPLISHFIARLLHLYHLDLVSVIFTSDSPIIPISLLRPICGTVLQTIEFPQLSESRFKKTLTQFAFQRLGNHPVNKNQIFRFEILDQKSLDKRNAHISNANKNIKDSSFWAGAPLQSEIKEPFTYFFPPPPAPPTDINLLHSRLGTHVGLAVRAIRKIIDEEAKDMNEACQQLIEEDAENLYNLLESIERDEKRIWIVYRLFESILTEEEGKGVQWVDFVERGDVEIWDVGRAVRWLVGKGIVRFVDHGRRERVEFSERVKKRSYEEIFRKSESWRVAVEGARLRREQKKRIKKEAEKVSNEGEEKEVEKENKEEKEKEKEGEKNKKKEGDNKQTLGLKSK